MARLCGKKGCKCALGDKRKMLYVPPQLEEQARQLVENAKTVDLLLEEMSQAALEHFIALKATAQGGPRP